MDRLAALQTETHTRSEAERGDRCARFSSCSSSSAWILPDKRWIYNVHYHGNITAGALDPVDSITALMETMSPQEGTMGQNRSDSLTGESKALPDNKKVPVTLLCSAVGADGESSRIGSVFVLVVCVFTQWCPRYGSVLY